MPLKSINRILISMKSYLNISSLYFYEPKKIFFGQKTFMAQGPVSHMQWPAE